MRRILIILGAIILAVAIGVGIYWFLFRNHAKLMVTSGTSFPAGEGAPAPDTTAGTPSTQELGVPAPGAGTDIAPHLVRISDRPVAEGTIAVYLPRQKVGTTTTGTTTVATYSDPDVRIEYIERESGNMYGFLAHARTLTRYTNKTLPGIEEASWLPNGSLAYARFLEIIGTTERIDTYALPANGNDGYFLAPNLSQIMTIGSSSLVTLLSTTDGSSASISNASGGGMRTLFSTPLSSIRTAVAGNNFMVTTKPSASMDGYAFLVDGKSGSFTRALGPLLGLSTLPSPDGKLLLYSYVDNGHVALASLDLTTHIATRLPLSTLAEKCAWTSDSKAVYCGVPTAMTGTLPDDWYQGVASFTDRIWKIDLTNRVATLVIDPKAAGNLSVDAVALALDSTNDVLVFTNRNDNLLYVYDL